MTYNQSSIIQSINILIPTSLAVMAILTYKKDNAGLLSLKQSIKLGVGVFLVAGIIGLTYFTIFINKLSAKQKQYFVRVLILKCCFKCHCLCVAAYNKV